jgi:hypothetical protein
MIDLFTGLILLAFIGGGFLILRRLLDRRSRNTAQKMNMVAVLTKTRAMTALDMEGLCTAPVTGTPDMGDLPMALVMIPLDMEGPCTALLTRHRWV